MSRKTCYSTSICGLSCILSRR